MRDNKNTKIHRVFPLSVSFFRCVFCGMMVFLHPKMWCANKRLRFKRGGGHVLLEGSFFRASNDFELHQIPSSSDVTPQRCLIYRTIILSGKSKLIKYFLLDVSQTSDASSNNHQFFPWSESHSSLWTSAFLDQYIWRHTSVVCQGAR